MKIELCERCFGEGTVSTNEYRNQNKIKCDECQGSGKIAIIRYKLDVPFKYRNNKKILNADEQIIEILRVLLNQY